MISSINAYIAMTSASSFSTGLRAPDAETAKTTMAISESTKVTLSKEWTLRDAIAASAKEKGIELHFAELKEGEKQYHFYPPGYPEALKAKIDSILDDPKLSLSTKSLIWSNMVFSAASTVGNPSSMDMELLNYKSPNFDLQGFLARFAEIFARAGFKEASEAIRRVA